MRFPEEGNCTATQETAEKIETGAERLARFGPRTSEKRHNMSISRLLLGTNGTVSPSACLQLPPQLLIFLRVNRSKGFFGAPSGKTGYAADQLHATLITADESNGVSEVEVVIGGDDGHVEQR